MQANHQSMFGYNHKTLRGNFGKQAESILLILRGRFTLSDKLAAEKKDMSLTDLTSRYGGQNYYHIGTSGEADGIINAYMKNGKGSADAGHVRYNVYDNQCAQTTDRALEAAGVPAGVLLTEWPKFNGAIMQGMGWQVNPTIPAAGAKG